MQGADGAAGAGHALKTAPSQVLSAPTHGSTAGSTWAVQAWKAQGWSGFSRKFQMAEVNAFSAQPALKTPAAPFPPLALPLTPPSSHPLWGPPLDGSAGDPRAPGLLSPVDEVRVPRCGGDLRWSPPSLQGGATPRSPFPMAPTPKVPGQTHPNTSAHAAEWPPFTQISPFRNEGGFNSASE